MRKTFITLIILLALLNYSKAGDDTKKGNPAEEKIGIAMALHASTNGFGGKVVYAINEKFSVRGGYESLRFNYNFDFDENDIDYNANFHFKTGSISVLADYYLLNYFYLSGGVGFNLMNSNFNGVAVSNWNYGDISIPKEDIGDFIFHIKPAFRLSPYAGIGFGRNIGLDKKFAVNFEIGTFYMGKQDVSIEATGLLAPTADPAHGQEELFENQLKRYRFYPVFKIGISYLLF